MKKEHDTQHSLHAALRPSPSLSTLTPL
jgi:hypothetical protein